MCTCPCPFSPYPSPFVNLGVKLHPPNSVGSFHLPLPLAFFTGVFSANGFFPWKSLHKMQINTVFCVQLSQFEFLHAYALLLHPVSATKLTFETTWKMSDFRISIFKQKIASTATVKATAVISALPLRNPLGA